jgi:hypothetical protein
MLPQTPQINADIQKQKKIIEDLHATIAKKAEQKPFS